MEAKVRVGAWVGQQSDGGNPEHKTQNMTALNIEKGLAELIFQTNILSTPLSTRDYSDSPYWPPVAVAPHWPVHAGRIAWRKASMQFSNPDITG